MHRFRSLSVFVVLSCAGAVAIAGDLNPPPGPVGPTMKSLDTLEPRVCLNDLPGDEGATVLITEPGSYFMNADIRGTPGAHGVRIVTPGDVEIDLNGFDLLGAPGSLDGINMEMPQGSAPSSLTVRCADGACRASIRDWGGDGLHTNGVLTCMTTHLLFENNGGDGVEHMNANRTVHRDIACRNNGGDGVRAGDSSGLATGKRQHRVNASVASGNGGSGFSFWCPIDDFEVLLDDSLANDNGMFGTSIAISPSAGQGKIGPGGGSRIRVNRWECARNDADGFSIDLLPSHQVAISATELSCVGNVGDGLAISANVAGGRHHGHVTVLKLCEFSSNGGNGSTSDNPLHVADSTWSDNAIYGGVYNGPDPTELVARLVDCASINNGAGGDRILRGRFSNVRSQYSDNGGSGITCLDGCVILDGCDITRSALCGVDVTGSLNATDCTFRRNDEAGCKTRGSCVMENVVCEFNGMGAVFTDCTTVTLRRCVFNENTTVGVQNRSSVGPVRWMAPECVANRNGSHGFDLDDCMGGRLERCVASGNGGSGFMLAGKVNRCVIEACSASANSGSEISVLGGGNFIARCQATANAAGSFTIVQGNASGPVIGGDEIQTNCNPNANIVY